MFEERCDILYFMLITTAALDTHYNLRGGAPYSDQMLAGGGLGGLLLAIAGGGVPSFADRMTDGGLGGFLLAAVGGGARNFCAAAGTDCSLTFAPPPHMHPLGKK
jgi:hypothetical protein